MKKYFRKEENDDSKQLYNKKCKSARGKIIRYFLMILSRWEFWWRA